MAETWPAKWSVQRNAPHMPHSVSLEGVVPRKAGGTRGHQERCRHDTWGCCPCAHDGRGCWRAQQGAGESGVGVRSRRVEGVGAASQVSAGYALEWQAQAAAGIQKKQTGWLAANFEF